MTHHSPITCVEHDGVSGQLFSGGYDGRVVGWSPPSDRNAEMAGGWPGVARWTVQLDDLVNDVRLSPDGASLAVAVADGTVVVLDPVDGRHQLVLGPHGDDVNVVRWLPDGSGLVCVMDHRDPAVRVWGGRGDANPGTWESRQLLGHTSGVFGAAMDPAGRRVATAAEDGTARIWDLDSLTVVSVLHHPGDPEAIDWSPDGGLIATGCDDKVCRLWDPERGLVVRELREATAAVRFVRFSDDGGRLLVGAYDATLRQYDTDTWQVLAEHRHPQQWERAGTFVGRSVVVASFGGNPILHPAPALVGALAAHRAPATPLSPDPAGPTAVPAATVPAAVVPAAVVPTFGINALAWAGDRMAVGRDDGSVLLLGPGPTAAGPPTPGTPSGPASLVVADRHASIVNTVAFSPDGALLASGDYRGTIRIVALAEPSPGVVQVHTGGGPINSVLWHPQGGSLFSAGYDGVLRQWSPHGEALASWPAHHGPVKSLAFSVPAGLLVAGSSDGTLSAWVPPPPASPAAQGQDLNAAWRAARPDLVLVNAVAADAVGSVVSASRDLLVRRWDARTGALLEALPRAHRKSIKAIATNAHGNWLMSGSYDGTAVLWHRDPDRWRWRRLVHHGAPGVPAVAI